ncbi:MAG TPA: hypothetical protein VH351_18990 [Bryobacteraceae bacterium]|jgi:hypothetical protein|nr:hypothetical protein [Bryobacteraceae bacterium]
MLHSRACLSIMALTLMLLVLPSLRAADHGPVFGLATPTNPQGGWSFDVGVNGRGGSGGISSTLETELTYGLTQNVKLAVSAPIVFQPDPYPRSSVTTNTPISGDFSGLTWWRFQKKDFKGKRVESTAVGGILVPGPQQETGVYRDLNSGVGYLVGAVTGIASRSQYVWVGASYQRYADSKGDRRPDLLSYTAVYGYRPLSWRTDYPRWDWRIFGEFTGERAGTIQRQMMELPGSQVNQMFFGPSLLGVYRAIGIEAGMQFPIYRDAPPLFPKERYRFALNFAYFF